MELIDLIYYLLIGLCAGILAGLLGISGGVITVPSLFFVFRQLGFPTEHVMHFAIGTSLAAMVFNAFSATYFHNRKKGVIWSLVGKLLIGVILGSVLGALIANQVPGNILKITFGVFACGVGLYFLKAPKTEVNDHKLPSSLKLNGISLGIGFLSNILGIGGGIITVPILVAYKIKYRNAIATSSAITLVITTLGAVAYLYEGLNKVDFPHAIGFLYIPAFLIIAPTTFLAAPFGVKLAHILPTLFLKRIFACALLITGIGMIL